MSCDCGPTTPTRRRRCDRGFTRTGGAILRTPQDKVGCNSRFDVMAIVRRVVAAEAFGTIENNSNDVLTAN